MTISIGCYSPIHDGNRAQSALTVRAKVIGYAALSAAAYFALVALLSNYAIRVNPPDWWVSAYGYTYPSMMVWWQMVHTSALFLLAIPVAFFIVRLGGSSAMPIAVASSVMLTIAMAIAIAYGWQLLTEYKELADDPRRLFSTIYDVLKIPIALLFCVWVMRRVMPSKQTIQ